MWSGSEQIKNKEQTLRVLYSIDIRRTRLETMDLSEECQELFEQKARDGDITFDDLNDKKQAELFEEAETNAVEALAEAGDMAYDAWKDSEAEKEYEERCEVEATMGIQK